MFVCKTNALTTELSQHTTTLYPGGEGARNRVGTRQNCYPHSRSSLFIPSRGHRHLRITLFYYCYCAISSRHHTAFAAHMSPLKQYVKRLKNNISSKYTVEMQTNKLIISAFCSTFDVPYSTQHNIQHFKAKKQQYMPTVGSLVLHSSTRNSASDFGSFNNKTRYLL